MLIVAGTLTVDPAQRDEFLRQRLPSTVATRDDPACLDHVLALDPVDPARLHVFERWETADALERHLAESSSTGLGEASNPAIEVTSMDLVRYEVNEAGPLDASRSTT